LELKVIIKKPSIIVALVAVIVGGIVLGTLAYRVAARGHLFSNNAIAVPTITITAAAVATPAKTTAGLPPVQNPSQVLGIEGDQGGSYPGLSWVRLGYPTCGWGSLHGNALKDAIQSYHKAGVRVLLTVCQRNNGASLFDTVPLKDAAQGEADAVQCGNEEMKQDAAVSFLYIPPDRFARFYTLCEQAVHAVRPEVPILLGSLDPHVGGVDYQPLVQQVQYLDQMQSAMNSTVRPGGHWNWRAQTLGLIDSWHNGWNTAGYPDPSVNSLGGLFSFWAQQFGVNLDSGQLGEHLWVVEGTGCFKGCGIDENSASQIAITHTLALITDVQTVTKDKVPFFYFSGKDFQDQGVHWPIGILDDAGHPKPIRQDLPMGARVLELSCSNGKVKVADQLQLLAHLYQHCSLPSNYTDTLTS
jgi:hypothetical protein